MELVHVQLNPLMPSTQTAPPGVKHGFEAHSSMLISQRSPATQETHACASTPEGMKCLASSIVANVVREPVQLIEKDTVITQYKMHPHIRRLPVFDTQNRDTLWLKI